MATKAGRFSRDAFRGNLLQPASALYSHRRPPVGSASAQGGITVQGQIMRARPSQGVLLADACSPAALFDLVRPERALVRFRLSTQRALSAVLQGFGELGWPKVTEDMSFAR